MGAKPPLHRHLHRVADSGVVGMVLWDAGGRLHEANDRFLEIVGYPREALAAGGLTWSLVTPVERQAGRRAAMAALRAEGIARGQEQELVRRDGAHVVARLHSALCDEPGKAISIVVDVTEQKRAEAERLSLMEREMQARAEAEAAVRSRNDILAIVSHDLRNPLNIVAMSASLLETPLPEPRRRAQLGIIRRAVERMNRLIGDLLDVTQIASGALRLNTRPVAVAQVCEEACQAFAPVLGAKGQELVCSVPEQPLTMLADSDRISQVLSNLIGNAHKFTPEGGHIELRAEALADGVRFAIADTGPGVDAEDLPHLFDRYWQARRVRRGGVGLGLPIARGIVVAHGGRIWAESVAGAGTTFFFTIPAP